MVHSCGPRNILLSACEAQLIPSVSRVEECAPNVQSVVLHHLCIRGELQGHSLSVQFSEFAHEDSTGADVALIRVGNSTVGKCAQATRICESPLGKEIIFKIYNKI